MSRFDEFIRERRLLYNVSPQTVSLVHARPQMAALGIARTIGPERHGDADAGSGLQRDRLQRRHPAVNAYLHWTSDSERRCGAGCIHPRIAPLKEPKEVLPALTEVQVRLIVDWRPNPKDFPDRRLHLLALLLLDTFAEDLHRTESRWLERTWSMVLITSFDIILGPNIRSA